MEIAMQPTYDNILDEWKSMYREEIGNIWKTERKELRRVAMVYHILKEEFARIEFNLNREMENFREKGDLIQNLKESAQSTQSIPLKINNSESQLSKSPKLNKYRKTSNLKKPRSGTSLFNIENKKASSTKSNHTIPTVQQKPKSLNIFNSSGYDGPLEITSLDNSATIVDKSTDSDIFKTPPGTKRLANADVVDSSFVVQDTPDNVIEKKFKWTSKKKSFRNNKSIKTKENKLTILDHLKRIPNKSIQVNPSKTCQNRNAEPITEVDKQDALNLDDNTFCDLVEGNNENILKKNILEENIAVSNTFFKNYDKFPVQKSKVPEHVHKTETIRRKADRMKLPGWSCSECEKYYEALDLPLEELRQKMNACSKHRNKFELLDRTPAGFWDVEMPETQENDTTLFNL